MHPLLNTGLRIANKVTNKINFLRETGRFFRDDEESLNYHLGDLVGMIHGDLAHAYREHRLYTDFAKFVLGREEKQWFIFPPQGIENLARENYQFALSFMHFEKGKPVVSIVIDCARLEIISATKDDGARYSNIRARVSDCRDMENTIWGVEAHQLGKIDNLMEHIEGIRTMGVPMLDCLQVGCGRYDGFVGLNQSYWDLLPALFIVKIAGGMVTDLKAKDVNEDSASFVVTNPKLMPKALKLLNA